VWTKTGYGVYIRAQRGCTGGVKGKGAEKRFDKERSRKPPGEKKKMGYGKEYGDQGLRTKSLLIRGKEKKRGKKRCTHRKYQDVMVEKRRGDRGRN